MDNTHDRTNMASERRHRRRLLWAGLLGATAAVWVMSATGQRLVTTANPQSVAVQPPASMPPDVIEQPSMGPTPNPTVLAEELPEPEPEDDGREEAARALAGALGHDVVVCPVPEAFDDEDLSLEGHPVLSVRGQIYLPRLGADAVLTLTSAEVLQSRGRIVRFTRWGCDVVEANLGDISISLEPPLPHATVKIGGFATRVPSEVETGNQNRLTASLRPRLSMLGLRTRVFVHNDEVFYSGYFRPGMDTHVVVHPSDDTASIYTIGMLHAAEELKADIAFRKRPSVADAALRQYDVSPSAERILRSKARRENAQRARATAEANEFFWVDPAIKAAAWGDRVGLKGSWAAVEWGVNFCCGGSRSHTVTERLDAP